MPLLHHCAFPRSDAISGCTCASLNVGVTLNALGESCGRPETSGTDHCSTVGRATSSAISWVAGVMTCSEVEVCACVETTARLRNVLPT